MKLIQDSVKNVVGDIKTGNIYLPPIQRSFVWKYDRIIDLFDSLYRDYPIGNFVFWKLRPETSRKYHLYKFIEKYSENKNEQVKNEHAPNNLITHDVYAVVDGQQRLSSLFIGLTGTYKFKKNGKGLKNKDHNFVTSKLYFNLFPFKNSDGDEELFDFLGIEDALVTDTNKLWFEVGLVVTWKNEMDAEACVDELRTRVRNNNSLTNKFDKLETIILASLKRLFHIIHDKHLCYFDVDSQDIDEVVEMFSRLNNGGMVLKKSDLLFSVLVSQWDEGHDEIRELVQTMNESEVDISQDFIMRACLVLSDLPVKYKLESFNKKNIKKIKDNWPAIKNSLITLCGFLPKIGYTKETNISDNSLIPIAYYIRNGGDTRSNMSRKNLQKYYMVAQVNEIFGGQSDQVLDKLRTEIRNQLKSDSTFNYKALSNIKLPGKKTFSVTLNDVKLLIDETSYGSPHAYFLLSLIYPTYVDYKNVRYDVDHIHPKSKFNQTNLNNIGICNSKIEEWKHKCNLLPNLELLSPEFNKYKRANPVTKFLEVIAKEIGKSAPTAYLKENFIPSKVNLDLKFFDEFYESRKTILINKLKNKLVS